MGKNILLTTSIQKMSLLFWLLPSGLMKVVYQIMSSRCRVSSSTTQFYICSSSCLYQQYFHHTVLYLLIVMLVSAVFPPHSSIFAHRHACISSISTTQFYICSSSCLYQQDFHHPLKLITASWYTHYKVMSPVVHNWAIKGLGMSSYVCVTG